MTKENPHSVEAIAGHPVHPMLVSFPAVCFVGAFVTDIVYWRSMSFIWETFSVWLLTAGLILGSLASLAGLIEFVGNQRIRALPGAWAHMLGNGLVMALSLVNVFVHSRDGYTAVVPTGLTLSGIVVLLLLLTGWMGSQMIYRDRVGVTDA